MHIEEEDEMEASTSSRFPWLRNEVAPVARGAPGFSRSHLASLGQAQGRVVALSGLLKHVSAVPLPTLEELIT
jgi:hypothetical protein